MDKITSLIKIICIAATLAPIASSSPIPQAGVDYSPNISDLESQPQEVNPQNSTTQPLNPFAPRTISYVFDSKLLSPYMRLHKLSLTSNNITCNDGSQVGYYIRQNVHSKSWIIYLQGGGFCGSEESCQLRWQRNPNLMSSNYWPKTKTVDGILSSEPNDNPYLWNANHVFVPYCSSDSWTGLSSKESNRQTPKSSSSSSFAFMGSKIIERVLDSLYDDLPPASSLQQAKFILLAGDSAGATGVILNLDKVMRYTEHKHELSQKNCQFQDLAANSNNNCNSVAKQPPIVRGLSDSGWFLDNEPYYKQDTSASTNLFDVNEQLGQQQPDSLVVGDCDRRRCSPLQSIKQAMRHWNGQVPKACANEYPTEPWRCYFGYRAYASLKTPLFVVQWLYDEAQLLADNIARPETSSQWEYVDKVVTEMRASLENVTALFAPSCFSHSLITRSNWNQININGLKLPHVLNSWEEQSLLETTPDNSNTPTSLSIMNQPTFETLMLDQDPIQTIPVQQSFARQASSGVEQQAGESARPSTNRQAPTTSKARGRKRKRNNNQHQRSKQTRQAPASPSSQKPTSTVSPSLQGREFNEVQPSYLMANPLQNLLPLIDKSLAANSNILFERQSRQTDKASMGSQGNGRLGRSTIVDDSSLMLSDNMPEELSGTGNYESRSDTGDQRASSHAATRPTEFSRFRLIDLCSWPQCNRDCPALSNFGPLIQA